jgi:hypothetical protein
MSQETDRESWRLYAAAALINKEVKNSPYETNVEEVAKIADQMLAEEKIRYPDN